LIIFSAAELSEFSALPTAVHDRAFYNAWTRKEALVKALGLGFSMDVTAVEVSFAPDVPARLVRLHGDAAAASEWTLVDLAAPRGFVAALAVRGPVGELELREWPTLNRE
jgi:4'-phosphopantetheinyl transferase